MTPFQIFVMMNDYGQHKLADKFMAYCKCQKIDPHGIISSNAYDLARIPARYLIRLGQAVTWYLKNNKKRRGIE